MIKLRSDFIQSLKDHFDAQGEYFNLQTLSAAISLFQSAIGNTYISATKDGRYLNGFYIGLGEPGVNKSILTKQLETAAKELKLSFPNVSTPEALVQFVGGQKNKKGEEVIKPHYEGFIIYDEVSRLFRSKKHMDDIFINLSLLWSSQRIGYSTTSRGVEGFEAGTAISLFGLGTNEVLNHIKSHHFIQGFGRRPFWYIIPYEPKLFNEEDFFSNSSKNKYELPNKLMEFLKHFRNIKQKKVPIMWNKEAKKEYIQYLNEIKLKSINLREQGKNIHRVWLNSTPEFLSMLSATKRLSRFYRADFKRGDYKIIMKTEFFVEKEDVLWAIELLNMYYSGFEDLLNLWNITNVVNKRVENIKPLIDKIESHIIKNISSKNLSFSKKKVKNETLMPSNDFEETFESMINKGIISLKSGERVTYYYIPVEKRNNTDLNDNDS